MRALLPLLALSILLLSAVQARADAVQTAFNDAIAAFEAARAGLVAESFGVDVTAYRDALTEGQFASRHWGGEIAVELIEPAESSGACARFAAYVHLPAHDGRVRMVVCPQFSADGTPALRRLTVLHEMVHVVAGADECRAMAFAARVELLANGAFTPVERYWRANDCDQSPFRLPD